MTPTDRGLRGNVAVKLTVLLLVAAFVGGVGCARLRGENPSESPSELGGKRLVYLKVWSEKQSDQDNRLLREVLVQPLREKVSGVLTNLGFRPGRRYTNQRLSLGVLVNRVTFEEKSVFGSVQMVIDHQAQCVSPTQNYKQSYTHTQTVSPDDVKEAREEPRAVIEEQYRRAVPELVRNLFNDKALVDCLVRDGPRPNPFQYQRPRRTP